MTTRHLTIAFIVALAGCNGSPMSPTAQQARPIAAPSVQTMQAGGFSPATDICPNDVPSRREFPPDPDRIRNPYEPPPTLPSGLDGPIADELPVVVNPCPGSPQAVVAGVEPVVPLDEAQGLVVTPPIVIEPADPEPVAYIDASKWIKRKLEIGFDGPGRDSGDITRVHLTGDGWDAVCDRKKALGCYYDLPHNFEVEMYFTWADGAPRPDWRGDPDCDDGHVTMSQDLDCTAYFFAPPPHVLDPDDTRVDPDIERTVPAPALPVPPIVREVGACAPPVWLRPGTPAPVELADQWWGQTIREQLENAAGGTEGSFRQWAAAYRLSALAFDGLSRSPGQVQSEAALVLAAGDTAEMSRLTQAYNGEIIFLPCPYGSAPVVG